MKKKQSFAIKAVVVLALACAMMFPASAVATETKNIFEKELSSAQSMNRDVIFSDGFESYEDFVVDNFPPWTTVDVDGDSTYGMEGVTWPNAYYIGAWMIFNPSMTEPPINTNHPAHSGDKYASCWASVSMPNNDWLITPQLAATTYDTVTFWARSLTDQYGLERFKVGVSTTNTQPASFTIISPGAYVQAPVAWTQYTYDISNYSGQLIYIAINCVSDDAFSLFVDDFEVTGTGGNPPIPNPGGPYTGMVGEEIEFTGSATGGTPPYTYSWDFGNGDTSTEQNPSYAYDAPGVYTVTLTATDDEGLSASASTTATIASPIQITSIAGGFGVSATLKNTAGITMTNVDWTISLEGGIILLGGTKSGTIASIAPGESATVKSIVLGFGKPVITVQASGVEKTATGTVLLFFVLGVQ